MLIRGNIGVGWGERPGGERQGPCQAVPIELIVDTADVIKTARNRVDGLEPNEYSLGDCDPNNSSESLCWNVIFEISDRQTVNILLDAYTGEIVNIFLGINKGENLGKDWKLE